ncbi:MAG: hypothetical protein PHR16_16860, partial [Methylovulum sp.]|nr:hypothetical protein [Methylovulum sp.]
AMLSSAGWPKPDASRLIRLAHPGGTVPVRLPHLPGTKNFPSPYALRVSAFIVVVGLLKTIAGTKRSVSGPDVPTANRHWRPTSVVRHPHRWRYRPHHHRTARPSRSRGNRAMPQSPATEEATKSVAREAACPRQPALNAPSPSFRNAWTISGGSTTTNLRHPSRQNHALIKAQSINGREGRSTKKRYWLSKVNNIMPRA